MRALWPSQPFWLRRWLLRRERAFPGWGLSPTPCCTTPSAQGQVCAEPLDLELQEEGHPLACSADLGTLELWISSSVETSVPAHAPLLVGGPSHRCRHLPTPRELPVALGSLGGVGSSTGFPGVAATWGPCWLPRPRAPVWTSPLSAVGQGGRELWASGLAPSTHTSRSRPQHPGRLSPRQTTCPGHRAGAVCPAARGPSRDLTSLQGGHQTQRLGLSHPERSRLSLLA